MTTLNLYLKELWTNVLIEVQNSAQINKNDFDLYFSSSYLVELNNESAKVVAPNFPALILLKEKRQLLEFNLDIQIGHHVEINFELEKDYTNHSIPKKENTKFRFISYDLNPNYTFSNFVVGRSNSQAHVASLVCSSNLGMIYNPLFIYGNTGLGKTHLLHAIGNQVQTLDPNKKIAYISSENFVEGVYQSIKNKQIDEFKEQFHDLDLLLVDDIQFIAGKNKTHEIFFSIFNDLISNRKQICITADKSPNDIDGLEERIISRFNQGLNINIESLEYETSLQIIKMKIANNVSFNQDIDEDVISYIATNCSQNVRTIEGALKRLLFYSIDFSNESRITLKVAVEALKDQINTSNNNEISITKIKNAVCNYYKITSQQLISKNRTKNMVIARHIAMYLCRKILDAPYKEIGNEFGKRDHSTVMNACFNVEKNLKINTAYQEAVSSIESKIQINPQ